MAVARGSTGLCAVCRVGLVRGVRRGASRRDITVKYSIQDFLNPGMQKRFGLLERYSRYIDKDTCCLNCGCPWRPDRMPLLCASHLTGAAIIYAGTPLLVEVAR